MLIRSGEALGVGWSRNMLYSGFNNLHRSVIRRQTGFAARITRTLCSSRIKMPDKLIERLDAWLAVNRPEYYSALRPGISTNSLDAFDVRFSLTLPESFRKLYSWRDGQPSNLFESIYENWQFLSLDQITSTKQSLDEMIGTDFDDPKWWRKSWIPFLGTAVATTYA